MGCARRSLNYKRPQQKTVNVDPQTIRKPKVTVGLDPSIKKKIFIKAHIKAVQGCSDVNRYVDYVLSWLAGEGIRFEKLDINSPEGKQARINKTPFYQIFYDRKPMGVIYGRGVSTTYIELVNYLNGLNYA